MDTEVPVNAAAGTTAMQRQWTVEAGKRTHTAGVDLISKGALFGVSPLGRNWHKTRIRSPISGPASQSRSWRASHAT